MNSVLTCEYDSVSFSVNCKGDLLKMTNVSDEAVDIFIPSLLPNWNSINSLSPEFVSGRFKTITISSMISDISPRAFARACAEKIVWSSSCDVIQNSCFAGCSARVIENIEHIREVERYGFAESNFEEIVWPVDCNVIPEKCFEDAVMRTVTNLQNVTEIGFGAFMGSHIESIVWPINCNKIPQLCFAGSSLNRLTGVKNVTEIGYGAFMQAYNLKSLDFSESIVLNKIGTSAFSGLNESTVVLPYYSYVKLNKESHFGAIKI